MDTITKVNHSSLSQELNNEPTYIVKLASSKFDSLAGSELMAKVESWVSVNTMMNIKSLPVLIIDMENVEFIDSQGLQKLLAALRLMQAKNSNLLLCSLQSSIRLVFEISRIDQLFAIFPSLDTFISQSNVSNQAAECLIAA